MCLLLFQMLHCISNVGIAGQFATRHIVFLIVIALKPKPKTTVLTGLSDAHCRLQQYIFAKRCQGKNDPQVPISESEQIVKTVHQQSVPVWYLIAKDEGHRMKAETWRLLAKE